MASLLAGYHLYRDTMLLPEALSHHQSCWVKNDHSKTGDSPLDSGPQNLDCAESFRWDQPLLEVVCAQDQDQFSFV